MKKTMLLIMLTGFILCNGCSPMSVRTDFDEQTNFESYETYMWMKSKDKSGAKNQMADRRIKQVADEHMELKGFNKATKVNKPDMLLIYHLGLKDKFQVDYDDYSQRAKVLHYKKGTLILDIIDAKSNQLVWRGWASGVFKNPEAEAVEGHINKAINGIMEKFPPQ